MKDQLFVLRPGFDDRGTRYFCPWSAQVIGFLAYYPEVRETIDIVELDYAKPRRPLSELLGEQHQSAPRLLLAGEATPVTGVDVREANGHAYIENAIEILRYLAATRGVPIPH